MLFQWFSHILSGVNYAPVLPLFPSTESCGRVSSISLKINVRLADMGKPKSSAFLFGILAENQPLLLEDSQWLRTTPLSCRWANVHCSQVLQSPDPSNLWAHGYKYPSVSQKLFNSHFAYWWKARIVLTENENVNYLLPVAKQKYLPNTSTFLHHWQFHHRPVITLHITRNSFLSLKANIFVLNLLFFRYL